MSSYHSLKLMLEEIERNPELTLFLTELMGPDSALAKLFLLHKDELFLGDESIKVPYLIWNNLPIKKATPVNHISVKTLIKLEQIKSEQALKAIPWFFNFTTQEMSEEQKDLLMYIAITVARQNQSIKELVASENFSFRVMKEVLKNYQDLCLDLPENLPEGDEQLLEKKAMQLATPMIEDMRTGRFVSFLEGLPYLFPDFLMSFHVREANQHLIDILNASEIEKDVYMEVINFLFSLRLISNIHTIFWCDNCRDQLQLLKTSSQISPHHLKIRCPRCKKPMLVSSIFRVHEFLRKCIVSQDGLLAVALAWLLKKNDVQYELSVYNEHEYDFVCRVSTGDILIECKMHRKPSNERSVRNSLENGLKQAYKHLTTLQKKNTALTKGYVVYNYNLEEYLTIVDDLCKKYENIEVIDQNDLDYLLQQIKPTQKNEM